MNSKSLGNPKKHKKTLRSPKEYLGIQKSLSNYEKFRRNSKDPKGNQNRLKNPKEPEIPKATLRSTKEV